MAKIEDPIGTDVKHVEAEPHNPTPTELATKSVATVLTTDPIISGAPGNTFLRNRMKRTNAIHAKVKPPKISKHKKEEPNYNSTQEIDRKAHHQVSPKTNLATDYYNHFSHSILILTMCFLGTWSKEDIINILKRMNKFSPYKKEYKQIRDEIPIGMKDVIKHLEGRLKEIHRLKREINTTNFWPTLLSIINIMMEVRKITCGKQDKALRDLHKIVKKLHEKENSNK